MMVLVIENDLNYLKHRREGSGNFLYLAVKLNYVLTMALVAIFSVQVLFMWFSGLLTMYISFLLT